MLQPQLQQAWGHMDRGDRVGSCGIAYTDRVRSRELQIQPNPWSTQGTVPPIVSRINEMKVFFLQRGKSLGRMFPSAPTRKWLVFFPPDRRTYETLFLYIQQQLFVPECLRGAHLVVSHWLYKGWSHFGQLLRSKSFKFVGFCNRI